MTTLQVVIKFKMPLCLEIVSPLQQFAVSAANLNQLCNFFSEIIREKDLLNVFFLNVQIVIMRLS